MTEQVNGMKDRLEDRQLRYLAHQLRAALRRDLFLAQAEHLDRVDLGQRAQDAELRDRADAAAVSGRPQEVRGQMQDPHGRDFPHRWLSAPCARH